jgi:hypothetical protein
MVLVEAHTTPVRQLQHQHQQPQLPLEDPPEDRLEDLLEDPVVSESERLNV